jgi:hypothetical protein
VDLLNLTPQDVEAVLTLQPVTWVLLYLILKEVRRDPDR